MCSSNESKKDGEKVSEIHTIEDFLHGLADILGYEVSLKKPKEKFPHEIKRKQEEKQIADFMKHPYDWLMAQIILAQENLRSQQNELEVEKKRRLAKLRKRLEPLSRTFGFLVTNKSNLERLLDSEKEVKVYITGSNEKLMIAKTKLRLLRQALFEKIQKDIGARIRERRVVFEK